MYDACGRFYAPHKISAAPTSLQKSGVVERAFSPLMRFRIHRSDIMSLTEVFTYDDSAHDYFEREPYCAKFHIFDAGLFYWYIFYYL